MRLTRADMQTDGAFYSMWSVGWVDFLYSQKQTTPIQWFGYIPWWGNLSFHAHPPFVFLIQHIFFKIFGESVFIARLPFALAGVGSLIVLYYIVRKLYDEPRALLSMFLLGINTFFTWSARITYLEAIETFFILLSFFIFLRFMEDAKFYFFFGISLGLTILTKYTSFFIIPVFIVYFFVNKENVESFKDSIKKFILSFLLAFIIFSPVILYNIMMLMERGHPDVQFSSVLPMFSEAAKKDWPILFQDKKSPKYLSNFFGFFFGGLKGSLSPTMFWAILLSCVWIFIKFLFKKKKNQDPLLIFSLIFLMILFTLIAPTQRYFPIVLPFVVMVLGISICDMYDYFKKNNLRSFIFIFKIFIFCLISYEFIFNINTNIAKQARGKESVAFSSIRLENLGFQQVEEYLSSFWKNQKTYFRKARSSESFQQFAITNEKIKGNNIFFFQEGLEWYATTWYFLRNHLYHNVQISTEMNFAQAKIEEKKWFSYLRKSGVQNIFYVTGEDDSVFLDPSKIELEQKRISDFLKKEFIALGRENNNLEIQDIYNDKNKLAFKIYKLYLQ